MTEIFTIPRRPQKNRGGQSTRRRQRAGQPQSQSNTKSQQNLNNGELITLRPSIADASVRRKFAVAVSRSSDASGLLAISSVGFADVIASLGAEYTNFAQEFSEFRPISLGIHFFPNTTNATSTTGPYQGGVCACPWAQIKLTTLSSMQQSNALVKFHTLEEKEIKITRPLGPNFLLWNPVGTAIPIDRDFGMTSIGLTTLAVSSSIFTLLYELEVEFRLPA